MIVDSAGRGICLLAIENQQTVERSRDGISAHNDESRLRGFPKSNDLCPEK